MLPKLNFNKALDKLINSYVKDDKCINTKLANKGFVIDIMNCNQFVLSILYKLKSIYDNENTKEDIKNNILTLYHKLVGMHEAEIITSSFNKSFNKSFG